MHSHVFGGREMNGKGDEWWRLLKDENSEKKKKPIFSTPTI